MPIRTQLLKKWVGPDPEKHIGSTPLHITNSRLLQLITIVRSACRSIARLLMQLAQRLHCML
jgi:hypothetical protein